MKKILSFMIIASIALAMPVIFLGCTNGGDGLKPVGIYKAHHFEMTSSNRDTVSFYIDNTPQHLTYRNEVRKARFAMKFESNRVFSFFYSTRKITPSNQASSSKKPSL